MPVRPLVRDQIWLLPPHFDDLLPADHPARFVASFVDQLDAARWLELGIAFEGEKEGAPAYHPRLLLGVWLYGFMIRVRSCRRLEAACHDQVPFIWLTGNQRPDHNTLWRFYWEHRQEMRTLLKLTVRTAVALGLVDLALQAVDGTKIAANASPDRTFNRAGLERLLSRVEAAIEDLEAQNATGGDRPPSHLPKALQKAEALREKVREALESLERESKTYTNLTDGEAALLRGRGGFVTGYNAQAVASPLIGADGKERAGHFITAAVVVTDRNDVDQLLPMLAAAEENSGQQAETTLADAGYHSGPNLVTCEEQGRTVVMPSTQDRALKQPYHKDRFSYDRESDRYTCPKGQKLRYAGLKRQGGKQWRRYRAESPAACRACPAFGLCTTDKRQGRSLHIGTEDEALRRHRDWMETEEAKEVYRQRKTLIEPPFGIIKEQLGGRRFHLRGLVNVGAEWSLLATAFNLRILARVWQEALHQLFGLRRYDLASAQRRASVAFEYS